MSNQEFNSGSTGELTGALTPSSAIAPTPSTIFTGGVSQGVTNSPATPGQDTQIANMLGMGQAVVEQPRYTAVNEKLEESKTPLPVWANPYVKAALTFLVVGGSFGAAYSFFIGGQNSVDLRAEKEPVSTPSPTASPSLGTDDNTAKTDLAVGRERDIANGKTPVVVQSVGGKSKEQGDRLFKQPTVAPAVSTPSPVPSVSSPTVVSSMPTPVASPEVVNAVVAPVPIPDSPAVDLVPAVSVPPVKSKSPVKSGTKVIARTTSTPKPPVLSVVNNRQSIPTPATTLAYRPDWQAGAKAHVTWGGLAQVSETLPTTAPTPTPVVLPAEERVISEQSVTSGRMVRLGQRLQGQLLVPLQMAAAQPKGTTVMLLTQPLVDGTGKLLVPAGSQITFEVSLSPDSGYLTAVAKTIVADGRMIAVPTGAITLHADRGSPLVANAYEFGRDTIRDRDLVNFLYGAAANVGNVLTQPNSSQTVTTGIGGSSSSSTVNPTRDIVGAVLAGGFNPLAQAIASRNEEEISRILGAGKLWYLPVGTNVSAVVTTPFSL